MIIYALHAICRAINRTRAAKATPPLSDYFTTRLSDYPYLGMHNSLQINGLRLLLRLLLLLWRLLLLPGHTKCLANMFKAGGQNGTTSYQVWWDAGHLQDLS